MWYYFEFVWPASLVFWWFASCWAQDEKLHTRTVPMMTAEKADDSVKRAGPWMNSIGLSRRHKEYDYYEQV